MVNFRLGLNFKVSLEGVFYASLVHHLNDERMDFVQEAIHFVEVIKLSIKN